MQDQLHALEVPQGHQHHLEERLATRVRVSGSGTVGTDQGGAFGARLHDISTSGVTLFLDVALHTNQRYQLHLNISRNGLTQPVTVTGTCMHVVLAGTNGFRHGFHFHAPSPTVMDQIRSLL